MKACRELAVAVLSVIVTATTSASPARDYAEADRRIEAASVRLTGLPTSELAVALSRDWAGKKKEDLERWFDTLPKRLDDTWISKKQGQDEVVVRISTDYPADQMLSVVFRFWLSTHDVIDRVQFYHEHTKKEANQSSQRNAMARPISVFESRPSRG